MKRDRIVAKKINYAISLGCLILPNGMNAATRFLSTGAFSN